MANIKFNPFTRKLDLVDPNELDSNLSVSSFTEGSVIFASTSGDLTENNSSFFWDNTDNYLGIGTNLPFAQVTISNGTPASGSAPDAIYSEAGDGALPSGFGFPGSGGGYYFQGGAGAAPTSGFAGAGDGGAFAALAGAGGAGGTGSHSGAAGDGGAVQVLAGAGGASAGSAAAGNGGSMDIYAGDGGAASGAGGSGGAGGSFLMYAGQGGDTSGSATNGGNAGSITIASQRGGNVAGSSGNGGSGGDFFMTSGDGGDAQSGGGSGNGGLAGSYTMSAGAGGEAFGSGDGGDGGDFTLTAGDGGGTGGAGTGGDGGNLILEGGAPGLSGSGTDGSAGHIFMNRSPTDTKGVMIGSTATPTRPLVVSTLGNSFLGLQVLNLSGSTSDAHAPMVLTTANSTGGDPYILLNFITSAGTEISFGMNNSESDRLEFRVNGATDLDTGDLAFVIAQDSNATFYGATTTINDGILSFSGASTGKIEFANTATADPGASSTGLRINLNNTGNMTVNDAAIGLTGTKMWFNHFDGYSFYLDSNNRYVVMDDAAGSVFNPDNFATFDFIVETSGLNHAIFVDSGNDTVGIGHSSPSTDVYLDVAGANNTHGALRLRAGNASGNTSFGQIFFSYDNSANYTHRIRTRHNSITSVGNNIDFLVWDQGVDATTTLGTAIGGSFGDGYLCVNSIDQTITNLGRLEIHGTDSDTQRGPSILMYTDASNYPAGMIVTYSSEYVYMCGGLYYNSGWKRSSTQSGWLWGKNANNFEMFRDTGGSLGSSASLNCFFSVNESGEISMGAVDTSAQAGITLRLTDIAPVTQRWCISNSTTNYFEVRHSADSQTILQNARASGSIILDFNAIPSDGTSSATQRFGRGTNTTGNVSYQYFRGDNTASVAAQIAGNTSAALTYFNGQIENIDFRISGDSVTNLFYVEASTNRVGINTNTPSYLLDVNGAIRGSDYYSGDGSQGVDSSHAFEDVSGVTHTYVFKDGLLTSYSAA